jgi:hypothetical protein
MVMAVGAQRRVISISLLFACVGALSACAASGNGQHGTAIASDSASPTPTGSATTRATAIFAPPATCTDLIGADLEAAFLADGNVLLTSPDGSGELPGGLGIGTVASTQESGTPFSCWYGVGPFDLSDFEVAAQGITQDARQGILTTLEGRALIESSQGDLVIFSQVGNLLIGDPAFLPATVHVVHPDSWITISTIKGGADQIAKINQWLPIVTAQVYP